MLAGAAILELVMHAHHSPMLLMLASVQRIPGRIRAVSVIRSIVIMLLLPFLLLENKGLEEHRR